MSEPPITLHAYHDDGPGNFMPTRVVIHTTEPGNSFAGTTGSRSGVARSTAVYFTEPTSGGSAHYIVDAANEEHCIEESHIAWHAPPNKRSLGVEICGKAAYTRDQWLSADVWPAMVRAAGRTADLCARYGIPIVKLGPPDLLRGEHGICGHVDVANAWHETDHTDPGPNFPWVEFMSSVHGETAIKAVATSKGEAMEIDLRVSPDGSFRRLIQAEAGSSSTVVARAWLSFGAAFSAGNTAEFDIYALDDAGSVMGPHAEWHRTVENNRRGWVELPSGVVQVTIAGTVPKGGEVSAALVTLDKPIP